VLYWLLFLNGEGEWFHHFLLYIPVVDTHLLGEAQKRERWIASQCGFLCDLQSFFEVAA
jgi:hypothetical protein